MRLAATGLVLAFIFAIAAPVYTLHALTDDEPHEMFDFEPPQTGQEIVAVTLSVIFVETMRRDDPKAACRLAAGRAARVLRCARAHPRIVKCGNYVYEADEDDHDVVDVMVAFCGLKVQRGKVVDWKPTGGLA
jgi:hypothetical protein